MDYRHHPVARQTGPDFSASLATNGYAWWYLDGLSDCGRYGLTAIAMLGSVFSPYYLRARRLGPTDPLTHSALNVALYTTRRGGTRHWAMTERDLRSIQRNSDSLLIGPSAVHWDGRALLLEVDEHEAPLPRALRGRIRFEPQSVAPHRFQIDRDGRHHWWPIAPRGRITLEFDAPSLRWQGTGYLDANQGEAPLEDDFTSWDWSRAATAHGTQVFYDTRWRTIDEKHATDHGRSIAVQLDHDGGCTSIAAPPLQALPTTGWGLRRAVRCDGGARAELVKTLENGPFYARSLVRTQLGGEHILAMHESVSLKRFAARWVQALLPVRARRG